MRIRLLVLMFACTLMESCVHGDPVSPSDAAYVASQMGIGPKCVLVIKVNDPNVLPEDTAQIRCSY